MSMADVCRKPRSARSVQSQMASFVVFVEAMYSALTVESVTMGCFFEDQETVLVLLQFSSELWFEPEPVELNPWFSSKFRKLPELNLKSGLHVQIQLNHY